MIKKNSMRSFIHKAAFVFCFTCCFLCMTTHAQFLAGITKKPDTSYTTWSAYQYSKTDNPQIKIVEAFNYNDVDVKKNINYCSMGERKLLLDAFIPKQSS